MSHTLGLVDFQMSVLLQVALAGYLAASLVNQFAVIGEILLGRFGPRRRSPRPRWPLRGFS